MRRKWGIISLVAALVFGLAFWGCGKKDEEPNESKAAEPTVENPAEHPAEHPKADKPAEDKK